MKQTKEKWNSVLWIEAFGFSSVILLSWLTELFRLPYWIYGEPFAINWRRVILRTLVVLLAWIWVHLGTRRLLKHLHYLEDFLRVCSWCRKVCHDEEWLTMEDYFNSKFATRTSHGICPECLKQKMEELETKKNPDPTST